MRKELWLNTDDEHPWISEDQLLQDALLDKVVALKTIVMAKEQKFECWDAEEEMYQTLMQVLIRLVCLDLEIEDDEIRMQRIDRIHRIIEERAKDRLSKKIFV